MDPLLTAMEAMLPVFVLVFIGAALRHYNILREEADQSLLWICVNLLVPCLIYKTTASNGALLKVENLLVAPGAGMILTLMGYGICWLGICLLKAQNQTTKKSFIFVAGMQNYGYFPIPILMALGHDEALAVLMAYMVGVDICLWGSAAWLQGSSLSKFLSKLFRPPLLALFAGVASNALGVHAMMPAAMDSCLDMLAGCAVPLALLLIGATFLQECGLQIPEFKWFPAGLGCLMRLGILPSFMLLIAWITPLTDELKLVLAVEVAMPSAIMPIVLIKHYGGHVGTAISIVFWTTLISLITMPLWLALSFYCLAVSGTN